MIHTMMNTLIKSALACLVSLTFAGSVAASDSDAFQVRVTIVTGERSKDSSSETTIITAERHSIKWERSVSGGHGHRTAAPAKEKTFKLSSAERESLLELIREKGLLATDSLDLPLRPPVFYFNLTIETAAGSKKGAVTVSGPKSAVELREKALYRNSLALVEELYRIMREQDERMILEELVQERS